MAKNIWDDWLQGGAAPDPRNYNDQTNGYSPLDGTQGPRDPQNYRPQIIQNRGRDDAANGPNLGTYDSKVDKNSWYSDVPGINFNEFISEGNSDWFRREWAKKHGFGEQTEAALSRFSPIPQYWMSALGQEDKYSLNKPNSPQRQADLMGKFYGRVLGPSAGNIDPKRIMENVINATWNSEKPGQNNYVANLLANPGMDVNSQIGNFWSYVNGTVGRLMPPATMRSYKNIIDRESQLFQDFMNKNPTVSMTFNRWIGKRLGKTGGL